MTRFSSGFTTASRLASLALLTLCLPTDGRRTDAAEPGAGFDLQVKPQVCVTLDADSPCTMQLQVSWSADTASDVCLRLAQTSAMLECWQQASSGSFDMDFARQTDAVFQLLDADSEAVLQEAGVSVVSRDLRDTRRRRRHVWSLL